MAFERVLGFRLNPAIKGILMAGSQTELKITAALAQQPQSLWQW